jgi:hypothetical protein
MFSAHCSKCTCALFVPCGVQFSTVAILGPIFYSLMPFFCRYISPYFINDAKTQKCEFEDALVLLVDGKVSTFQQVIDTSHLAHTHTHTLQYRSLFTLFMNTTYLLCF